MKGYDAKGETGPSHPLPDSVTIVEPQPDKIITEPLSEQREPIVVPAAAPVEEFVAQPPAAEYAEPAF